VGGGNWNKNVISLCKATDSLSLPLVLVNKIWTETEIDPNVENHPLEQVLHFIKGKSNFHTLGFVETEELVNIYNLATVYVQPSIYEGFGLPVLEAMSSGTPVICAKNSSLAEIGGRAPEYINDPNSDEIASAIKKVFGWSKLEREKKVKIGLSESKHFSWELTGKATIGIYKKLLNS
jgi:glycosyltransferase involved in cell wall biosynthesis